MPTTPTITRHTRSCSGSHSPECSCSPTQVPVRVLKLPAVDNVPGSTLFRVVAGNLRIGEEELGLLEHAYLRSPDFMGNRPDYRMAWFIIGVPGRSATVPFPTRTAALGALLKARGVTL